MPTHPRSFRLGQAGEEALQYLALVSPGWNESAVIRELVLAVADKIWNTAVTRNPALAEDTALAKKGGSIVSREEQEAWTAVWRSCRN